MTDDMTSGIGRFRTDEAQAKFYAAYDRAFDRLWPAPCETLDVVTRFGPTRVYRQGRTGGEPIVLLAGSGGNALMWYHHVRALGEQHSVYALDTLGDAGRSIQRAPIRDGNDGAAWLREVLEGLDVPRAHLVGCSYGGWLAMHHAIHAPARTASLCLLDPAGFARPGVRFYGWLLASALAGLAPAGIRRQAGRLIANGTLNETELLRLVRPAVAYVRGLPPDHVLTDDQLRALSAPVLLLLGARSSLHDPAAVRVRADALMPNAHSEIVPGAGHALPIERPELTATLISEFVQRHRTKEPASDDTAS
jgi:pimeloyl-ACP methyl ester carboxylesterase